MLPHVGNFQTHKRMYVFALEHWNSGVCENNFTITEKQHILLREKKVYKSVKEKQRDHISFRAYVYLSYHCVSMRKMRTMLNHVF